MLTKALKSNYFVSCSAFLSIDTALNYCAKENWHKFDQESYDFDLFDNSFDFDWLWFSKIKKYLILISYFLRTHDFDWFRFCKTEKSYNPWTWNFLLFDTSSFILKHSLKHVLFYCWRYFGSVRSIVWPICVQSFQKYIYWELPFVQLRKIWTKQKREYMEVNNKSRMFESVFHTLTHVSNCVSIWTMKCQIPRN